MIPSMEDGGMGGKRDQEKENKAARVTDLKKESGNCQKDENKGFKSSETRPSGRGKELKTPLHNVNICHTPTQHHRKTKKNKKREKTTKNTKKK